MMIWEVVNVTEVNKSIGRKDLCYYFIYEWMEDSLESSYYWWYTGDRVTTNNAVYEFNNVIVIRLGLRRSSQQYI